MFYFGNLLLYQNILLSLLLGLYRFKVKLVYLLLNQDKD
ncbi:hypothetical protein L313_1170 [Acinetobacter haemolyticus CIP 64.3 = MTCC 9819]|nr:hypothetical protein L313_1170 [Acinetobacter haemolyticus CIP 64.3 = MTCC 9819]